MPFISQGNPIHFPRPTCSFSLTHTHTFSLMATQNFDHLLSWSFGLLPISNSGRVGRRATTAAATPRIRYGTAGGCGTGPRVSTAGSLPGWALEPPKDSMDGAHEQKTAGCVDLLDKTGLPCA